MNLTPALRFLSNQVWAIHPPVFDSIAALLESHANGERRAAISDAEATSGEPGPQIVGNIGVVPIRGVIARYADQINGACQDTGRSAESLQRDLLALDADPRVERVVLRIDSPGGTVSGTAETAATIRAMSKPVTAYVDGMAASAAYWLASQADEIVMAGPTSEVGSIGVITAHVDATRAQDRQGYRVQVLRTAPLKAPGAMGEALNADQMAAIQRDLADFHAVFADAVAAGRGLTEAQVAAATTGEMWRPDAAIRMGLADRVASWDAVVGGSAPMQITGAHRAGDGIAAGSEPLNQATAQAAATNEASAMDTKLKAKLAALCQQHPTHAAALVAEAMKDGATEASIQAHADGLIAKATAEAHAAELADIKAKLAAAEAKATEAEAARVKLGDELKAAAERLSKYEAHVPKHQDPGPLAGQPGEKRKIPVAKSASLTKDDLEDIKAGRAVIE